MKGVILLVLMSQPCFLQCRKKRWIFIIGFSDRDHSCLYQKQEDEDSATANPTSNSRGFGAIPSCEKKKGPSRLEHDSGASAAEYLGK
jgi:hypothetical protein